MLKQQQQKHKKGVINGTPLKEFWQLDKYNPIYFGLCFCLI